MPCPHCRHPNPPTAKFCSGCGSPLEIACGACGCRNAPGSRFCNECGEALTPAPGPSRSAPESYIPQHLAARILT
ncbi:MAG: zinc ribbon domain-containing protein, partial [Candidatus Rokuibacteriota bacterium]